MIKSVTLPTKVEASLKSEETIVESNSFNDKLYAFVKKGEGSFQYKAFCDDYYKLDGQLIRKEGANCGRWSIGYGTKSFRGEIITLEEGIERKQTDLMKRKELITSTCLSDSQLIVTLDYLYQHGSYSKNVVSLANNCDASSIYYTIANWRDYYKAKGWWGMVKREQLRLNYFYN